MTGVGNRPAAEVDVDDALVRQLLAEEHPDLADRELRALDPGWDNAMFRLGHDLVVRLPRRAASAELVGHEQAVLPRIATHVPLPVPAPVRVGAPGSGYPWRWSVVPWIEGTPWVAAPPADVFAAADALGGFVAALHALPADDAPANPFRGGPLAGRDEITRERVAAAGDLIDGASLLAEWDALLPTPVWTGPPRLLHGDLHESNVLVRDGRVAGVIDFGDVTTGDPATDLSCAWILFRTHAARSRLRWAVGAASGSEVDDATWARARAWALTLGLAYLTSSADDPVLAAMAHGTIAAVLSERIS